MGMLDGKSAVITGAGRGLGRAEALLMAKEGCNLVINDLGAAFDGTGDEAKVADLVVEECKKLGVKAVGNYDSVADYNKAKGMLDQAISEFGRLDIVVNNAGILRDRMIFNMSESDWDGVIAVHLKGTFNLTRHAAAYFREKCKADPKLKNFGRIINTASDSGLLGNLGQSNYGAAKSAIATFSTIVSGEIKKYATVNTVVPSARTRMTTDATPKTAGFMSQKGKSGIDLFDPAHFAPIVAYLASDKANRVTGEVFRCVADKCWVYRGWHTVKVISNNGEPFTAQLLADRVKSELLKDIPPKLTSASFAQELMD
ncbi:MAG: SDR family NAD(P)-dependent oxidoreductase [Promethearchaeota archaeon]